MYINVYVLLTSEHAECYGLGVFGQQISLGYGRQREITGHVPAELSVPSVQEPHRHRDGQHHDRRTTVVLRGQYRNDYKETSVFMFLKWLNEQKYFSPQTNLLYLKKNP